LRWFFPRPRLKDGDPTPDDIAADLAEAIADRMEAEGLWSSPPGTDGIYVSTTRAVVLRASTRPAMAKRAVFVIGDAERMVSQEGKDEAANAFLKLLEEPPPGTTIILLLCASRRCRATTWACFSPTPWCNVALLVVRPIHRARPVVLPEHC